MYNKNYTAPPSLRDIAAADPDPDFDTDSLRDLIRRNNDKEDSDNEYQSDNVDDIKGDDCGGGEDFESCDDQSWDKVEFVNNLGTS